jgi:hypothetical protein
VRVVEQTIEEGGDSGGVAEQTVTDGVIGLSYFFH